MHLATFLVPLHDNAGKPYDASITGRLQAGLLETFFGWTSLGYTNGAWQDKGRNTYYDRCERFQVGLADASAVSVLRALLADLAAEMGQDSIWLTVQVVDGGCVDARKD